MIKKILIALFVVFSVLFFSPTNNIAFAKKDCSKEDSFFGLPAWYRGLVDKGTCQIIKKTALHTKLIPKCLYKFLFGVLLET